MGWYGEQQFPQANTPGWLSIFTLAQEVWLESDWRSDNREPRDFYLNRGGPLPASLAVLAGRAAWCAGRESELFHTRTGFAYETIITPSEARLRGTFRALTVDQKLHIGRKRGAQRAMAAPMRKPAQEISCLKEAAALSAPALFHYFHTHNSIEGFLELLAEFDSGSSFEIAVDTPFGSPVWLILPVMLEELTHAKNLDAIFSEFKMALASSQSNRIPELDSNLLLKGWRRQAFHLLCAGAPQLASLARKQYSDSYLQLKPSNDVITACLDEYMQLRIRGHDPRSATNNLAEKIARRFGLYPP